jgi:S1-C subfamily serine protease
MKKLLATVITVLLLGVGATWADPNPRQGWLGVRIMPVTQEIAESLGLHDTTGALVVGVTLAGPAEAAQIIDSDIILQFNGQDVKESHALPPIVAETAIGSEVTVTLLRDGKKITVTAKWWNCPTISRLPRGGLSKMPGPLINAVTTQRRCKYIDRLQSGGRFVGN